MTSAHLDQPTEEAIRARGSRRGVDLVMQRDPLAFPVVGPIRGDARRCLVESAKQAIREYELAAREVRRRIEDGEDAALSGD